MPAQKQSPIAFTVTVSQKDWDEEMGGWRCSALKIPSAQVDAMYIKTERLDKTSYEVLYEHTIIRWIPRFDKDLTKKDPPKEALFSISLTERLSTEELTLFWRKLAILLPPIAAVAGALIAGIFLIYSSRTPSNPREFIAFNLLSPMVGDCGAVTIYGSVEMSAGSQGKVTRVTWDWGDGVIVDGSPPASHHYARNDKYSVKVTAYGSNNETESRTIPVNITSVNPNCR